MPPAPPIIQYRNVRDTAKNTDSSLSQCNFRTSNRGRAAVAKTNLTLSKTQIEKCVQCVLLHRSLSWSSCPFLIKEQMYLTGRVKAKNINAS